MQTRRRTTRPPRATFLPQKPRMGTPASLSSSSHAAPPSQPPMSSPAMTTGEHGAGVNGGMMTMMPAASTPNAVNSSAATAATTTAATGHGEYAQRHANSAGTAAGTAAAPAAGSSNSSSSNQSNSSTGYHYNVSGNNIVNTAATAALAGTTSTSTPLVSNGTSNGGTSNNSMAGGSAAAVAVGSHPDGGDGGVAGCGGSSMNSSSESILQRLVREAGVEQRGLPLSDLRRHIGTAEVVLGIDGAHLLQRMTAAVRARDPMAVFTTTMPIALYEELAAIRGEVDGLGDALAVTELPDGSHTRLGFKPVFVFDGIGLSAEVDPPLTVPPRTPEEWRNYHAHEQAGAAARVPPALRVAAADRFRCEEDVHGAVVRQLKTYYRNVFRAPYVAAAQLSAFLLPQNRYVSEVYGSVALLAYPGVERVVTRIDADARTFDVVYKSAVLECMNRHTSWQRKFTEADLAEWIVLDMMQEYMHLHLPLHKVRNVLEGLLRAEEMPEHGLTASFATHWSKDLTRSLHASLALLDAPVLMSSGACLPLHLVHNTAAHSHITLRKAFGVQLPAVLYFSLFAGLVSPTLIATSAQHCLVDRWPLVDSAAYREVQRVILPLRIQACCQLLRFTSTVPRPQTWYRQYAQVRRGNVLADEKLRAINLPDIVALVDWDLAGDVALNGRSVVYFSDAFAYTDRHLWQGKVHGPLYHTVQEMCGAVLLKTLDILGYMFHDYTMGKPRIMSTTFSSAMSRFTCDTLSEYALLMIEMLRTHALTDDKIQTTIHGSNDAPTYPRGVRFAARLLSIIPLNLNGPWSGPFDVEMAAFSSLSRSISRTLRGVVDALATLTFMTQATSLPPEQLADVIASLPFHIPIEFAAGNLMLYVLQNPQCTLAQLEQTFPECYTLQSDLYTLFAFWEMAYAAIIDITPDNLVDIDMVNDAHAHMRAAAARLGWDNVCYM